MISQAPVECGFFLLIRFLTSSRAAVIAENLFLREQLALFHERMETFDSCSTCSWRPQLPRNLRELIRENGPRQSDLGRVNGWLTNWNASSASARRTGPIAPAGAILLRPLCGDECPRQFQKRQ